MLGDVERINTRENRQLIPERTRLTFDQYTNRELEGMALDTEVSVSMRTYARYELAYREAWGIYVDLDPDSDVERHHRLETEQDMRVLRTQLDQETAATHANAEALRARMALAPERPVFVDITCPGCGQSFKSQQLHGPLAKRRPLCSACLMAGGRRNS